MQFTAKNDDGVSPVIGTILLVAITVVLVAIVAAVVMGMVGSVQSTKDVGVTVSSYSNSSTEANDGRGVQVLLYGGNDIKNLRSMDIVIDGITNIRPADGYKDLEVGKVYTFPVTGTDTKEITNRLVIVTGNFSDGTTSVLAQTSLTIPKAGGDA